MNQTLYNQKSQKPKPQTQNRSGSFNEESSDFAGSQLLSLQQVLKADPEQTLQQFYKTAYMHPSHSLQTLANKPFERIKKIQSISNLKPHELETSYLAVSLPVLRKANNQKKNWGNEHTRPELDIRDSIYASMRESCIVLENNKKIH